MTDEEDYKQLLVTALQLADRNCSEQIRLRRAIEIAIAWMEQSESLKAYSVLKKAIDPNWEDEFAKDESDE